MFDVILYTEKELLQMHFPEEEKIKSKYIFCDFEKAKNTNSHNIDYVKSKTQNWTQKIFNKEEH